MSDNKNDWISARAYALWQQDGQAHGKDVQHWQQASREFEQRSRTRASADGADIQLVRPKKRQRSSKAADSKSKMPVVTKTLIKPAMPADV